ncbi:cytochrome c3 family protein [Thiovibrio sp. JS02]
MGSGGAAFAFHSGGVGECGGCHSMHSSVGTGPGSFLLLGSDQSSTCLNCHEQAGDSGPSGYHVSTAAADMPAGVAPLQKTPGGDFGWLKKDYSYTVDGVVGVESGHGHGHNIVAVDQGYGVDPVNAVAPGGSFPSAQLACNSCHDPHGKYRRMAEGNVATSGAPIIGSGSYADSPIPLAGQSVGVYRLLAGNGYKKANITYYGVPVAVAPSSYNRSEAVTQTRVAYGVKISAGNNQWGQWCTTCHPNMHNAGNIVHPIDQSLGPIVTPIYQRYVRSGDFTGANATSYLSLVPFAQNTGSFAILAAKAKSDDSQLGGPTNSSDKVMCLSCHRAHASGWEYMMRWNNSVDFITFDGMWPGIDNGVGASYPEFARGRTEAETLAAMYDRPAGRFATHQRALCNKCHAKD